MKAYITGRDLKASVSDPRRPDAGNRVDNLKGNMMNDQTPVFYQPGRPGIIDLAIEREGIMTGGYSGETLEQVRLRYPGAELGELGPVAQASEGFFRSPPKEIDEARFMEMLEVLPPVCWTQKDGCESFKLSERTSGTITAIFARIGSRYFELSDSIFMQHCAIIAKCKAAMKTS